MEMTISHVRYLLAIDKLLRTGEELSSSELARALRVSKPAVNRMLRVLIKKAVVQKEPYGKIELTERGRVLAREYETRICMVYEALAGEIPLTEQEAEKAACAVAVGLPERCFRTWEKKSKPV